jgi:hypothetical protein
VPLALTGDEWIVLMSAVVPAVLATVIVIAGWQWSKRDESLKRDDARKEAAIREARGEPPA